MVRATPNTRRLRGVVLLLIGGAVVNVLVAWGCAWLPIGWDCVRSVHDPGESGRWQATRDRRRGRAQTMISIKTVMLGRVMDLDREIGSIDPSTLPAWCLLELSANQSRDVHVWIESLGWPRCCLECQFDLVAFDEQAGFSAGRVKAGIPTPWHVEDFGHFPTPIVLPLKPVPGAFATNTAFYALLLALLVLAVRAARSLHRLLRRRRGRCMKCGYHVRTGGQRVCPECGQAVAVDGDEKHARQDSNLQPSASKVEQGAS